MPFSKPVAKVLLVDDEAVVRFTISALLMHHGFIVRAVAAVPEAVDLIHTEAFNILLCDLNIIGRHDGLSVVEAMRRQQPSCLTFILTATPDLDSLLWAIRHKVDDYFLKVQDEEGLPTKLMAHLSGSPISSGPDPAEYPKRCQTRSGPSKQQIQQLFLVPAIQEGG